MRAHHMVAVIAVLVVGLGVKQLFFPPISAGADLNAVPGASMDILQMQIEHANNLPVQKMHDMTMVFADGD